MYDFKWRSKELTEATIWKMNSVAHISATGRCIIWGTDWETKQKKKKNSYKTESRTFSFSNYRFILTTFEARNCIISYLSQFIYLGKPT